MGGVRAPHTPSASSVSCRRRVNTDPGVACRQGVKIRVPLISAACECMMSRPTGSAPTAGPGALAPMRTGRPHDRPIVLTGGGWMPSGVQQLFAASKRAAMRGVAPEIGRREHRPGQPAA